MTDIEKLTGLVTSAMEDIEHCDLTADVTSPELVPLMDAISKCLHNVKEVYQFTASIADGNFQTSIPDRHNYFVGPSKDLYYKLQHLTWQAKEVAKGDYSQRVDFLGSFSDSFNYMITELERREKREAEMAEEKLRAAKEQNDMLRLQMERQMFHFKAYRSFIYSYQDFRNHYKQMMGEVYSLFNEKKYEEGRLLISRINDMMATEVVSKKDYSNNDFVNAAIANVACICEKRNVPFSGQVYIPEKFNGIEGAISPERVFNLSELVYSLLEIGDNVERSLSLSGGDKNGWYSLRLTYTVALAVFPETLEQCIPPESLEIIEQMKQELNEAGSLLNINYQPAERKIEFSFHIYAGY